MLSDRVDDEGVGAVVYHYSSLVHKVSAYNVHGSNCPRQIAYICSFVGVSGPCLSYFSC